MGLLNNLINRLSLKKKCPKCGTSYIGAAYQYKPGGITSQGKNYIEQEIHFSVKCPKCGHIYKFEKCFTVHDNGAPIETLIDNFCEKIFGSNLDR